MQTEDERSGNFLFAGSDCRFRLLLSRLSLSGRRAFGGKIKLQQKQSQLCKRSPEKLKRKGTREATRNILSGK